MEYICCDGSSAWKPLYVEAIKKGIRVPKKYEEYAWLSYETVPLPTKKLQPHEILSIRDKYFLRYFKRKREILKKVKEKFGRNAIKNINEMTKIKLKRKVIEEANEEKKSTISFNLVF